MATVNGLTLINLSGFLPGVAADETAINVKTFKTVVEPEFRNVIPGKNGAGRGFVCAPMKKNVTIDGEVTGSTGVMAAVIGTAFTPANSSAYFGAPTTGLYLLKGEVEESREQGECAKMSAEFEALAGIA
jgi:hypothetical protein